MQCPSHMTSDNGRALSVREYDSKLFGNLDYGLYVAYTVSRLEA